MGEPHTDHRAGHDPADQSPEWGEIYGRLKEAIGDWQAFNWFGCCGFVDVDRGVIRLLHWNAFVAQECLRRHGADLCKIAGARAAQVSYSGGTRPGHLTGPAPAQRHGTAHYRLPVANSETLEHRRDVIFDLRDALTRRPPGAKRYAPENHAMESPPAHMPPAPPPDELQAMRARNPLFDGAAFPDASRLGEISLDTASDGADGITPPEDGQRPPDDVSANYQRGGKL